MNVNAPGRQVKGILNSDDLSTAAPVIWYDAATHAVFTLGTNDRVIIYMIAVSNGGTAVTVEVFDDKDGDGVVDAGEPLFQKNMGINELAGYAYTRGLAIERTPKVKASAASAGTKILILADVQE